MVLNAEGISALDLISQIQLPLRKLELEIQRLTSENEALKLDNRRLKDQDLAITQENTRLKSEAERLKQAATIESHNSQSSITTSIIDTNTMVVDKQDFERMELQIRYQRPLVDCAIRIRKRFYEQTREHFGMGKKIDAVVTRGDIAAHQGNFMADDAMYALKQHGLLEDEKLKVDIAQEDFKAMFHRLYGTLPAKRLPLDVSPLFFAHVDMVATLRSISSYTTCEAQYSDHDLQKHAVLDKQTNLCIKGFIERMNTEKGVSHKAMMDKCPIYRKNIEDKAKIIERCVQRRQFLKRQKANTSSS